MPLLLNLINRCWLMYIVGGIVILKMVSFSAIDYQYLDTYRPVARQLVNCVSTTCAPTDLKNGLRYYVHWGHIFTNNMEPFNAAGYCFYHLHEYRHALEYFTLAIKKDPNNAALYYNQALALFSLGDYAHGLAALRKGSSVFKAEFFLNPSLILPFKKDLRSDFPNQPSVIYNLAVFEYKDLLSLAQQIDHASDLKQRKILIEQLRQKINRLELYYYIPVYTVTVHGNEVILI
jgi:tetratricopeptide (TPR) repeat protein